MLTDFFEFAVFKTLSSILPFILLVSNPKNVMIFDINS